jgi:hypothetical protein
MSALATLPAAERREIFEEVQVRAGTSAVTLEKDFWVVWLLERIFRRADLGGQAVFKGGTSLSKVFHAIARFSEDIDLGISPASLGYDESELEKASKNAWNTRLRPGLEAACAKQVESHWLPVLAKEVTATLGTQEDGRQWLRYHLDTTSRSPVIFFDYPRALKSGLPYIDPSVKIEFGSLADQRPTGRHAIQAMVTSFVPGVFEDVGAEVVALELERTFWEKATILHAEFHRPTDRIQPPKYARHYADFATLWKHPAGAEAAKRLDLWERVRRHKSRFFASAWANYATAIPGSLRLTAPAERLATLEPDYAAMQPMFLAERLTFAEILATLREAEQSLNQK